MTDKLWTGEDQQSLVDLNAGISWKLADKILSLLHSRGLLRGSHTVGQWILENRGPDLADIKQRYPDLVSQIQAEERNRIADYLKQRAEIFRNESVESSNVIIAVAFALEKYAAEIRCLKEGSK